MKYLHVITDLQFGSTGKGLYAGWLARELTQVGQRVTAVTAWGPNAGHTYMDENGNKWVHTMLANSSVIPGVERVLIGPGSVINPNSLLRELEGCGRFGQFDFWIHEHAAVLRPGHHLEEQAWGLAKIGSTMKGTAAAMVDKMRREPGNPIVARDALRGTPLENHVVGVAEYNRFVDMAETVICEGAQGFSLGINNGFYPYTTSRECTTAQILSDCAIPLPYQYEVHGVCRTLPIRVNNREGTSGPCYSDQREIQWEELGVLPELTTVTKLPRRLFTFSNEQIRQAVRMNRVDRIFLNFCNYARSGELSALLNWFENEVQPVFAVGYGPKVSDIRRLED